MSNDKRPGPEHKPKPDDREQRGPRMPKGIMLWLVVVVAVVIMTSFSTYTPFGQGPRRLSLQQFSDEVKAGTIRSARVQGRLITGELVEGGETGKFRVSVTERYLDSAKLDYLAEKIPDFRIEPPSVMREVFLPMIPWLVFVGLLWFVLFRQMRVPGGTGGILSFGKSRAKLASKDTGVTLDDVAGIDEAKNEVKELVEFLRNPEQFRRLGGRAPRGVMLIGAPGTGKTLLAKAIAGEAGVPFLSISGSDFVEMFVGVGASRVRDLFRQAKESPPCIVFLDEIDAVGRRRGSGLGGGHDEREQTLNAILVEMDGFERDTGVIIIAATNRPDVLDPALLRPGRFDRHIVVDLPDVKGREGILAVHAAKVKMADDVDLEVLARGTPAFSGADLEAVINEGAIQATMRDKAAVGMDDLEEARDKVRWGKQKRSRVMTEDDRRMTAIHESGHAVIAYLDPKVEPLHKVTIIPRGMSLGSTMVLPKTDRYDIKRGEALAQIAWALGGRVAEEAFCEDISSGAEKDLEQATDIARRMVCKWGMSEIVGPLNYSEGEEHLFLGREITRTKTHSEAVAVKIDAEIKAIIDQCHESAKQMIEAHREGSRAITDALLRYESLDAEEVDRLMKGENAESIRPATEPRVQQPSGEQNSEPDNTATDPQGPPDDKDRSSTPV